MPDTIQFGTGNQIINRYAASRWLSGGRKLGTEYFTLVTNLAVPLTTGQVIKQTYTLNVINQNGTAYIDNKEYNTFNGNSTLTALQRIYNSEGYADTITATVPNYKYYRRDHLGNNREVWVANTKKTIQRTQYYPSGLPWASNTGDNPGQQERKYNGKEFVEMHGYDTYDYGARGYYPAMGCFQSVDPLAEIDYSVSPYAYCKGNPVNMIDPTGMIGESSTLGDDMKAPFQRMTSTFVDKNNKILDHRDDGDPTVYMVENEKEWIDNGKSKVGLDRVGDEDPFINYNKKIGQTYIHFNLYDNWIDNLAMHMRNSGWEDEDKAFLKSFGPIIMGLVLLNPIIGATNDAETVFTSKDVYNEKVSQTDKGLSGISLLMLGTGEGLKLAKSQYKTAIKLLDRLSKAITVYSSARETQKELKKEKK